MTAEIAVLNSSAVALAADSAVSSPIAGQPIYNSANKIFALSLTRPVGAMIYGNAQLNGVPWETIIKMYRAELGHSGFARLADYRSDLVRFLQRSTRLFSASSQERFVRGELWAEFNVLRTIVEARLGVAFPDPSSPPSDADKARVVETVVRQRLEEGEALPLLDGSTSVAPYLAKNPDVVTSVRDGVFRPPPAPPAPDRALPLSAAALEDLDRLAEAVFARDWFSAGRSTGVVIAGFGEDEVYPQIAAMRVTGVFNGWTKHHIDHQGSSAVIGESFVSDIKTYGDDSTVYAFIQGIESEFQNVIFRFLSDLLTGYPDRLEPYLVGMTDADKAVLKSAMKQEGIAEVERFRQDLNAAIGQRSVSPLFDLVARLPKEQMAELAESLVNITSFKKRISMAPETVGGPIDVAVISKGDGLIWIKRKHYFDPALNPGFVARRYTRGVGGDLR